MIRSKQYGNIFVNDSNILQALVHVIVDKYCRYNKPFKVLEEILF